MRLTPEPPGATSVTASRCRMSAVWPSRGMAMSVRTTAKSAAPSSMAAALAFTSSTGRTLMRIGSRSRARTEAAALMS